MKEEKEELAVEWMSIQGLIYVLNEEEKEKEIEEKEDFARKLGARNVSRLACFLSSQLFLSLFSLSVLFVKFHRSLQSEREFFFLSLSQYGFISLVSSSLSFIPFLFKFVISFFVYPFFFFVVVFFFFF